MSFEVYVRDVATRPDTYGDEPVGVGPDPEKTYCCRTLGDGNAWNIFDEDMLDRRWIISTEGVELADMR